MQNKLAVQEAEMRAAIQSKAKTIGSELGISDELRRQENRTRRATEFIDGVYAEGEADQDNTPNP